jgi:hypothetical protein
MSCVGGEVELMQSADLGGERGGLKGKRGGRGEQ